MSIKVRHKQSGQEYVVSNDYFERNSDRLETLEKIPAKTSKPKAKTTAKKQTKVITPETEVEVGEGE